MPGGTEADVGLDGAGEQEGVLKDNAEQAAEVLKIDFADVNAVEKNLAALDVIKAQEKGDQRGFTGAGVADDGKSLAGLDAERDIAEDPVVFARIGNGAITEPNVAKFDFAAGIRKANRIGWRANRGRLVEQFENALGSGHGGLQDVEFFAEILDGAEEARGEHGEHGQNAQTQGACKHAVTACPVDEGNGGHAENFDGGIEERVREDGAAPSHHVFLIALGEFGASFHFAVKDLHDAHAGNVFLQE